MFNRKEYMKEYNKKHHKEYYQQNKQKILTSNKTWRKSNPKKMIEYSMNNYRKYKEHWRIRVKTRRKYGMLPKEWEYHHFTEPYNKDLWIGVHYTEHKQIDKIWKVV